MKILLIEDDPDVRNSLVQILQDKYVSIDVAQDGPEGLYRATGWTYDVIVLDIVLPGMDGWEVLEKLRSRDIQTPVLMLTALNTVDNRIRGLEAGADDYLGKPFHIRELNSRVRALHRRVLGNRKSVLTVGALSIDTSKRTVDLRGDPLELTAARYRILTYLAERAGEVVSRTELAEATTSDEGASGSNVIDVQIHYIRRKLGPGFIESRRGHGYIMLVPES